MTASIYLIKALENYPYYMEECLESLNYALAYEENNAIALCLMGRIQNDYFGDTTLAIDYFESALASNLAYPETYSHYIQLLIQIERLETAEKLIVFAEKNIPHQKGKWMYFEALVLERKLKFKKAIKKIDQSIQFLYLDSDLDLVATAKSRIEKKKQHEQINKK